MTNHHPTLYPFQLLLNHLDLAFRELEQEALRDVITPATNLAQASTFARRIATAIAFSSYFKVNALLRLMDSLPSLHGCHLATGELWQNCAWWRSPETCLLFLLVNMYSS